MFGVYQLAHTKKKAVSVSNVVIMRSEKQVAGTKNNKKQESFSKMRI